MTLFLLKHRTMIGSVILVGFALVIVASLGVEARNNEARRDLAMRLQNLDISPIRTHSPDRTPRADCGELVNRTLHTDCQPSRTNGVAR